MEMKETQRLMLHENYKARFIAEYWQTKARYDKLHKMLIKAEAGTLNFQPTCPIALLREQASCMGNYLRCLEVRAEMEHIDLDAPADAFPDLVTIHVK